VAAPSGIPVGDGLGPADEADGDAVPGEELGLPSRGDEVQPTSTSNSAALARAHADARFVLGGGRRIIATTLAGRGAYGLVGNENPAKV
jgi:hypothetical protein